MKVSVKVTVDIDPEAWAAEYGIARSEVREDVRDLVINAANDHLAGLGLLAQYKCIIPGCAVHH